MNSSKPKSNSVMILPSITLIVILTTLLTNILSNFFPPKDLNIGQIANTILAGVQIIPANYAFAIWGLIYLGLITYGIYQLHSHQRADFILRRVNLLLITACIAQIVWIYLFTLRLFWLSVIAIFAILIPLVGSYLLLGIGQVEVSRKQKWMVHIPFSIYLAWISVATIINIASALYISGWNGWGINAVLWSAIALIFSTLIASIVTLQRADTAFTLVFIWAYVAIAIRQWNTPTIWITALASAVTLGIFLVVSKNRKENRI